jgi:pimeloyl-ACP methyl ester carboxylesterase
VLDLAPKEPFVLVGLSLGGYVAFEIMRQAPERVAALALLDTSARPESPEARAARTALMTLAETDLKAVFEQLMPRLSHPDRMNQPAVRGVVHSMMSSLGKGIFLRQQRMIMTRPDSRPSLADIRCPTLVICGREDLITPLPIAAEIAAGIQDSRLCIVENCGHLAPRPAGRSGCLLLEWITHSTTEQARALSPAPWTAAPPRASPRGRLRP